VTNVFFRDVAQAVGVGLQFWFWLTPIVYPLGAVPGAPRTFMVWNPLYAIVTSYQRIVVDHQWPVWSHLWLACVVTLAVAAVSEIAFRHLAPAMVDEL
jgi:lipopolysaccharide transport system permease protein